MDMTFATFSTKRTYNPFWNGPPELALALPIREKEMLGHKSKRNRFLRLIDNRWNRYKSGNHFIPILVRVAETP